MYLLITFIFNYLRLILCYLFLLISYYCYYYYTLITSLCFTNRAISGGVSCLRGIWRKEKENWYRCSDEEVSESNVL